MQSDGSLLMCPLGTSEAERPDVVASSVDSFVEPISAPSSRRSSIARRIRISRSPTGSSSRRNSIIQNSGSSSLHTNCISTSSYPLTSSNLIPLTCSSSDPVHSFIPCSISSPDRQCSASLAHPSPSSSRLGNRLSSQVSIHRPRSMSVPRQPKSPGMSCDHGSSSMSGSPLKLSSTDSNCHDGSVDKMYTPAAIVAPSHLEGEDNNVHFSNADTYLMAGTSDQARLRLLRTDHSEAVLSASVGKLTPPKSKLLIDSVISRDPLINVLDSTARSSKPPPGSAQSPSHSPSSGASFHTPSPNNSHNISNSLNAPFRSLVLPESSLPLKSSIVLYAPPMSFSGDPTKPSPEKGSPLSMSNFEIRGSSSCGLPIITSLSRSPSQSKTRTHTQNNSPSSKRVSAFDFTSAQTATSTPDNASSVNLPKPFFQLPMATIELLNRINTPAKLSPNNTNTNSNTNDFINFVGTPKKLESPRRQTAISPKPTLAASFSSWFKRTPPRHDWASSRDLGTGECKHISPKPSSPRSPDFEYNSVNRLNVMTTASPPIAIATVEHVIPTNSRSPILEALSSRSSPSTGSTPIRAPVCRTMPPSRPPPAAPSPPLPIASPGPLVISPRSGLVVSPNSDSHIRPSPPSRPPPATPRSLMSSAGSGKGSKISSISDHIRTSPPSRPPPPPRALPQEQPTPQSSFLPKFLSPLTPKLLRPKRSPLSSHPIAEFGATPSSNLQLRQQPVIASRYQFSPSVSGIFGPSVQGSPADSVLSIEPLSPHERGRSPASALSAMRPSKPFEFHDVASSYPAIEYEDVHPEVSVAYPSIHYEHENKEGVENLLVQPSVLERVDLQERPPSVEGRQSIWRFFSATGLCIVAVISFTIASLVVRPPVSVGPIIGWALLLLCQALCFVHYLAKKAVPKPKHPSKAVQLILRNFHTFAKCESLFALLPQSEEGWVTQEDFRTLLLDKTCDNLTQAQIMDCIQQEFGVDKAGNVNALQILTSIRDHTQGSCLARFVLRARLGRFAVPLSMLPLVAVLFEITTLILQACVLLTSLIPSISIYIFGAILLVIMAGGSLFLREMARVFPPFQWLGIVFLVVGSFLFTLFCLSVESQDTLLFFAGFIPQVHSFVVGVSVCSLIAYHDEKMGKNNFLDAFYALSKTKHNSQVHKSASLLTRHQPPLTPTHNHHRGSIHSLHETKRLISDSPFQGRRVAPMVPLSPVSYKTKTRNAISSAPSPLPCKPVASAFPKTASPAVALTAPSVTPANTPVFIHAFPANNVPSIPASSVLSTPVSSKNNVSLPITVDIFPLAMHVDEGQPLATAISVANKGIPVTRELRPYLPQQQKTFSPLPPTKSLLPVLPPPPLRDKTADSKKSFRSHDRRSFFKDCCCELWTLQGFYRLCAVIVALLAILIGLSVGVRLFEGPRDCRFPVDCRTPRYVRALSFVPICECDDTHVDLSGRSLLTLPSLVQFARLHSLNLTDNELSALPPSFCTDLSQLTSLDLSGNKLQSLPSCFIGYASLTSLNASSNSLFSLSSLPLSLIHLNVSHNTLSQLPNLSPFIRSLDLSFNQLGAISFPVAALLEILDISNNRLLILPNLSFPRLLFLDIANNSLSVLPTVMNTPELRVLDCSENVLERLPSYIGGFEQLRFLNVRSNKLSVLPTAMSSLPALQTIDLSKNLLRIFPSALLNCSSLTTLSASFNQLREIPASISSLSLQVLEVDSNQLRQFSSVSSSLRSLNISNNNLIALPLSLGACEHLEQLDVSRNQLSSIPFLKNITKLRALYISHNRLSSFPLGLSPALESLIITHNFLMDLPNSLPTLSNLTSLDLSHNALSEWPLALSRLPLLQSLKLSFNQLTSIPSSASEISLAVEKSVLREVFLDGNGLYSLPQWLTQLRFLQVLNIANNKIVEFPEGPWLSFSSFDTLFASFNNIMRLPFLPPALKILDVSNNKLSVAQSLLARVTVSTPSLLSLSLANNNLTRFPEDLSQFHSMTFLSLAHNHFSLARGSSGVKGGTNMFPLYLSKLDLTNMGLTSLPSDLSLLSSLRHLVVTDNLLSVLPTWVCGLQTLVAANNSVETLQFVGGPVSDGLLLPRLESLDLSSNEISGVNGEAISLLPSLQDLNLAHNWIFSLPPQFLELDLKFLSLYDNPICRDSASSSALTILRYTEACRYES